MNREDFPMLKEKYIYFNNASTTFKPYAVLNAMNDYYMHYNANTNRGVDSLGYLVTTKFEDVREKVSKFINANADEIVFTRGTTDSLNLVASSFGKIIVSEGDEVIISIAEHHSNFIPWQMLCKEKNAKLVVLNTLEDGTISPTLLKEKMNKNTKIVALNHVSNTMGGINKLKELSNIIHSYDAYFVVDGAQGILNEKVDVKDMNIDFYAFSSHKIFGPMGVGVLYGKGKLLEKMNPVMYGGEMMDTVDLENTVFKKYPYKFEAGTMMIPEVLGLGAAIDYINSIGLSKMHSYVLELKDYLIDKLKRIENIKIYNEFTNSGIISFNIEGIHAHDIASMLDKNNIILRAGYHCAQPLLNSLNITSSVRISLAFYNNKEECDKLIEILKKASDYINELF